MFVLQVIILRYYFCYRNLNILQNNIFYLEKMVTAVTGEWL